jgi:hypothetical protein
MFFSYRPLTGTALSDAEWKQDFNGAQAIKALRFGSRCLHLGQLGGLFGRYLPYEDIARWYLRIEAANGGEATFHLVRFVVQDQTGREHTASLGDYNANLNEKTPVPEIQRLVALHPEIPFGRNKA